MPIIESAKQLTEEFLQNVTSYNQAIFTQNDAQLIHKGNTKYA